MENTNTSFVNVPEAQYEQSKNSSDGNSYHPACKFSQPHEFIS